MDSTGGAPFSTLSMWVVERKEQTTKSKARDLTMTPGYLMIEYRIIDLLHQ